MPKPKTNLFCGSSFFKRKKKNINKSVPDLRDKTEDGITTNFLIPESKKIKEINELYADLNAVRLYERYQDKNESALSTIYNRLLLKLTDKERDNHKSTRDLFLETLIESEAASHLFSIYSALLNGDLVTADAIQNAASAKTRYEDFVKNISPDAKALHEKTRSELEKKDGGKHTVKPVEIAIKLNNFASCFYQKCVKGRTLNDSDKEKVRRFEIYKSVLTEEQKREYEIRLTEEARMRKPLEDTFEPVLDGLFWSVEPGKQTTDADVEVHSSLLRWNW